VENSFRALSNRNYRLYFSGQLISVIGNGMQLIVQAWLVYRLTHSAYWLGIISVCSQVPAFFASPFAGILADHKDRRKILLLVQVVGMLQAFLLAALVLTKTIQVWHIAILAALLGVLNAFEITTRHAFAVDLVGKNDLGSAISLNSATISASRVLGPALGGILIGPLGEGRCFLLNGISYLAVVYGLLAMNLKMQSKEVHLADSWEHLGETIAYIRRTPLILKFMGLATFISFVGFSYSVLLPVVAKDVLHGSPSTFAILSAAGGSGAILGAILLGNVAHIQGIYRKVFTYVWLMGCGFVLLGLSNQVWLSTIAMFLVGCFMMGAFPIINTSIQNVVEDSKRGRVMSIYTMTFFGATPLGSLLAGFFSDRYGAQRVAIASGLTCIVFGLLARRAFGLIAIRFRSEYKEFQPFEETEKTII
jgi:MFS family permease